MNDLLYSVGLDITDLKTSARAAKEQADDIKRGLKGFKDVIEFGGVGVAVVSFFRSVFEFARNAKGPIDDNVAAVRRLGDQLEQSSNTAKGWGAEYLGRIVRIGEWLGTGARALLEWDSNVIKTELSAQKLDRTLMEAAEKRKKEADEFKKLNEGIVSAQTEASQLLLKQLSTQEQFNLAAARYEEIQRLLANFQGEALERRRLELKLQQASVDVLKLDAELNKEEREKKKKATDEAAKASDQHIAQMEKLVKLRFDELTDAEQLVVIERQREQIVASIAQFKKDGKDTSSAEIALLETTNELEKVRTAELTRQAQIRKEEEESARRARAAAELERRGGPIIGTAVRSAQDFAYTTDEALQQLVNRNRNEATRLRNNNPQNFYEIRLEAGRLETEAMNAEAELKLRQRVRSSFQRGGAAAVYSSFPELDPLVIDRLITQFAAQQSTNEKTLSTLSTIEERLSTILPRRAPAR